MKGESKGENFKRKIVLTNSYRISAEIHINQKETYEKILCDKNPKVITSAKQPQLIPAVVRHIEIGTPDMSQLDGHITFLLFNIPIKRKEYILQKLVVI